MITKRRLALLSALSAAPAFAAPFLAIGDNAELFLTARTEVRYEDNVTFATDTLGDPALEDEVFEVSPGAEVVFGKNSLTKGAFGAFEKITSYSDNNNLNSNLTNIIFTSKYDGAKLDLNADASFRELNQNSRDLRGAILVRRDVYAASLNGEYSVTEKSKVGLGGRYDRTQYKTSSFVDQKNYTVPVDYYFAITEKVDLSAGAQYRRNDVAIANADSEDYYFNVGARGEFTAKLSGKFTVGYVTRNPDAAGADDEGSLGFKAGLAYAYSPKTTFTLDLNNDFETDASAFSTETSSISLGVTTSLTAALRATAIVGYSQYDYVDFNREDDYFVGGISFNYIINEHVNLDAGYSINDNDSNLGAASFTANVVRIAANFRY
jgi:polysaccharide biosynthesis protein VpsM